MHPIILVAPALGFAIASQQGNAPPAPINLVGTPSSLAFLLENSKIREELELDKDQVRSVMLLSERTRTRAKAAPRGRDSRQRDATFAQETNDSIVKVLSPEQLTRFKQIALQAGTVTSFVEPSVKQALKLDERQVAAILAIQNEGRRAMLAELKAGKSSREDLARKALSLRQEGRDQAIKLLTDEQKAVWTAITGKPFFDSDQAPLNLGPKKELEG